MSTNNKYLDGSGVRHLYHNIIKPYVDGADSVIKTDIQALSEKCAELEQRMIPITHHELVSLRDAGNLIPGMQYRITDYEFTTMSDRWKAKPSTFDIIVTADDASTLNESARAVARENVAALPTTRLYAVDNAGGYLGVVDTNDYFEYEGEVVIDGQTLYKWRKYERGAATDYFVLTDTRTFVGITADNPYTPIGYGWTDANGQYPAGGSHTDKDVVPADGGMPEPRDYAAWELKYTVDNILWSRRVDNYIFTDDNLLFESRGTIDINGETWYLWYNSEFASGYEEATQGYLASLGLPNINDGLSVVNVDGGTIIEAGYSTCLKVYAYEQDGYGTLLWLKDEYRNEAHYDHHNALFYFEKGGNAYWTQTFNNGHDNKIGYCFFDFDLELGMNVMGYGCYNNKLGNNCASNSFGNNCYSNSFGTDCTSNSFGTDCYGNSFGNNCYSNSFGNNCASNSFGTDCYSNSFGTDCTFNSFGNNYESNSFGNNCYSNSFGNNCVSNSFGNNCYSNSFGNNCYGNSFGNSCYSNSFGNNCYYNSFGEYYNNNTFGNYCTSNSFGNNCYSNSFGNRCYKISILTQDTKYTHVLSGTNDGKSTTLTIPFEANVSYSQYAGTDSSGNLNIWIPSELESTSITNAELDSIFNS